MSIVYPTARYLYGSTMEPYRDLYRFYSSQVYPNYNKLVHSISSTLDNYD